MDETIADLRDALSRLDGPARVPVLVRLGHELTRRYWRAGPGQPAALADLSAAVEAWDAAYRLLDAGDPARGQVAAQLGWLLAARHGAHGGDQQDRDTGLFVLGEALTFTNLPPALAAMARLSRGQLFLGRATEALSPAGARAGFRTGLPPSARTDAAEARRLFQEVLDGPPLSADVVAMTRTMLTIAESIQPLLDGDLARFDLNRIMEAMAAMQRMRHDGMPPMPWVPGDPLDYPVTVMHGEPPAPPRQATPAPASPARAASAPGVGSTQAPATPPPVDAESARGVAPTQTPAPAPPGDPVSARGGARRRLAALAGGPDQPVWEQARALLRAGHTAVAPADLDGFVGAAVHAVDADAGGGPVERGLDRLLSTVGLCLRQRRDGSGWGDGEDDAAFRAPAEHLVAAAGLVPPEHPAAVAVVEAVGGLLDDARPLSGVIDEIADTVSAYAARMPSRPPVVAALADLCHTVAALRDDAAPPPFAVAVPSDHPWHRVLSTAVAHARLAAAVRAGEPIDVDPALGPLAGVLDAVLRDDDAALRAALDAVPGPYPPRTAATLGAVRLKLGDLDAAIAALSPAVRDLDDDGLRGRGWWRLAEAYRRRGAAGDADRSRAAGSTALRCPGADRRRAARFAGWMLAEGRASEAFAALEHAAAAPDEPPDPLARDLLSVLVGVGVAPRAAAAPDVPSPAAVAAAVREIGATALLYLHPTDDARRTAGVLCLDAATDRLDLLANVPLTDPLGADDPALPAVLGRWTSGSLLVAASGGLDRLALAAVRGRDDRRLVQDVVLAHVSSGAEVIDLAGRSFAPVTAAPVFVVNPRGDRDPAMAEVMAVRRLFYPRSACLGRALEPVDGAGTPDDVRGRLPGASVVHLACGLRGTSLQLAGDGSLDAAAVRGAGGLAILTEGWAPALLDAGFAGVVGWQWQVPPQVAALALFMLHLHLVDRGEPPAAAVNAVQRWMLDPARDLPPFLTAGHLHTIATTDLTSPTLWAALAYRGR
ncbi:CHAT domain-containing protein [Asanoa siamensis]|uniref:CHAT domain-containing protein n=1 Tax=Asanoa siamensis TaxID=926357 RepID=UPI0019416130|nr:CHAT domain-containing protein [Asanoa siamensis]